MSFLQIADRKCASPGIACSEELRPTIANRGTPNGPFIAYCLFFPDRILQIANCICASLGTPAQTSFTLPNARIRRTSISQNTWDMRDGALTALFENNCDAIVQNGAVRSSNHWINKK
jgi:hypothetical protein